MPTRRIACSFELFARQAPNLMACAENASALARCVGADDSCNEVLHDVLPAEWLVESCQDGCSERKPMRACEPSQSGFLSEAPQRHSRTD